MRKVTEKDILAFTYEFVKKVCEIDPYLIDYSYEYVIRWDKKELPLDSISDYEFTLEDLLDCIDPAKYHVTEYSGCDGCIACLFVEGDLYELLYYYEGYGYGGEKAKQLLYALDEITDKYGMFYSWTGAGSIALYEK